MASFESANLDHEMKGKFVHFKLDTKLRFGPEEVGNKWLVQVEFWEKDPMKDDQIFLTPESVRVGELHAGQIRYYIEPSNQEVEWLYDIEIPAHLVDTEPGKEEVYSKLKLRPVGEGSTFRPADIITNITHVDV